MKSQINILNEKLDSHKEFIFFEKKRQKKFFNANLRAKPKKSIKKKLEEIKKV